MSAKKPIVGYVVYWPPLPGLPYLAVTFKPDGKVEAAQFETPEAAEAHSREMAQGSPPQSNRH